MPANGSPGDIRAADGDRRAVHHRIHPRDAQHARLRGAGHHDAGGRDRPHRRLQDRSDADRWPALRPPPLRELGRQGVLALFADSTNIDRQGFTGPETEVIEAFEEVFTSTHGKLVVAAFSSSIYRMQVLVDLARSSTARSRSSAAAWSRTRRSRSGSDICGCLRRADPRLRRAQLRVAGRAVRDHRVAGRAAGGALAHRHRRSPHVVKLGPDDVVVFSARAIPGQREGHRPHDEPHRPPRRRRRHRRHEARARLRARHRRGAEADDLARPAALLRADSRRVPATGAARAGGRARDAGGSTANVQVLLPEDGDIIQFDQHGRAHRRQGADRPRADRRDPLGEVGDEVLRDRRHLAGDGLVVAVVAISRHDGALVGEPDLVARGYVVDEGQAERAVPPTPPASSPMHRGLQH